MSAHSASLTAFVMAAAPAASVGSLTLAGVTWPCALGRAGCRHDKYEGDGATPIGTWPLRSLLYRADRLTPPSTRLPLRAIAPDDGWCDAPSDPAYNRPVKHPYGSSAERLWRDDPLYDLIVVLGYNDAPVVPSRGSAIFIHIARDELAPTEGCIALARDDLIAVLSGWPDLAAVSVTTPRDTS
jgi:L,D-peptidoglycan transpeptidase YkuD (ErfK/YbiS/YcfS/YnhG family)